MRLWRSRQRLPDQTIRLRKGLLLLVQLHCPLYSATNPPVTIDYRTWYFPNPFYCTCIPSCLCLSLSGSCLQVLSYLLQLAIPPFPIFVCSFFITGIGLALQDAQANGFVASLEDNAAKMGILHAAYGWSSS